MLNKLNIKTGFAAMRFTAYSKDQLRPAINRRSKNTFVSTNLRLLYQSTVGRRFWTKLPSVIVDCVVYEPNETPKHFDDLSEAEQYARKKNRFLWVGLAEPTPEEFEDAKRVLDLHQLAVDDSLNRQQRPKFEQYDGTQFLVMRTVKFVNSRELLEFNEVMAFVGPRFVVTVRHGDTEVVREARARYDATPALYELGAAGVLYALVDQVVDEYLGVSELFEPEIDAVEAVIFSAFHGEHARRIYELKREVLEFRQAVNPLTSPLDTLVSSSTGELKNLFRDVLDHLLRVRDRVDSFDSLLSNVLSAHLAQISVRQNEDMRKISAWVAIVAVPTMIAGIYGMNFEHMPELGWAIGYPFSLGTMLVVCTGLFLMFRRRGWL